MTRNVARVTGVKGTSGAICDIGRAAARVICEVGRADGVTCGVATVTGGIRHAGGATIAVGRATGLVMLAELVLSGVVLMLTICVGKTTGGATCVGRAARRVTMLAGVLVSGVLVVSHVGLAEELVVLLVGRALGGFQGC